MTSFCFSKNFVSFLIIGKAKLSRAGFFSKLVQPSWAELFSQKLELQVWVKPSFGSDTSLLNTLCKKVITNEKIWLLKVNFQLHKFSLNATSSNFLVVIHGQISQSTVSKLRPSRKDLVIWNIQFLDLFGGYLFSWANWIPVLIVCT